MGKHGFAICSLPLWCIQLAFLRMLLMWSSLPSEDKQSEALNDVGYCMRLRSAPFISSIPPISAASTAVTHIIFTLWKWRQCLPKSTLRIIQLSRNGVDVEMLRWARHCHMRQCACSVVMHLAAGSRRTEERFYVELSKSCSESPFLYQWTQVYSLISFLSNSGYQMLCRYSWSIA